MIKNYRFKITDEVVIVGNARDLADLKGEKGNVVYLLPTTHLNDYEVELDSGKRIKVKEKEIAPIENKELLNIKIGQKVIHAPTNEEAEVYKIDYLYGHVGLKFKDGSTATVGIESVRKNDNEGEKMEVKDEQPIAVHMLEVFYGHYKNKDGTYTVPAEVLINLIQTVYCEE